MKSKYESFKSRLSAEKRGDVDLWNDQCTALWKEHMKRCDKRRLHSHRMRDYGSRRRRDHADLDQMIEKHLSFLKPEQKEELKKMKADGATMEAIKKK